MRKQLDKKMAVELLTGGRTHADDFYSRKTGKLFSADLLLDTCLLYTSCEYSQENGRLVVVAKKIAEKEITK